MLLRTVLLLFLCVSAGMCATLGHYQAQAKEEEEAPAVTDGAAAEVEGAEEVVAPADAHVVDTTAAEEPEDNALFGDNLQAEIVTGDDTAANKPEVDVPEEVGTTAEELGNEIDGPAGDVPVVEALTGEAVTQEQPSSDDVVTQDKPSSDDAVAQDKPSLDDAVAQDKPSSDDAVAQDKPSSDDAVAQDKPSSDDAVAQDKPSSDDAVAQDKPSSDDAVAQEKPSDEEGGNEIEPVQTQQSLSRPLAHKESNSWGLNSIRNSFQTMHGYFDSLVELVGGHNGVCQYRCRYGETPEPRPGYQLPEPNGCSSSLVGIELDMGIPAMTKCCNELDMCYDTCGSSKYDCDSKFRTCLHDICSDVNKSLGFVSKVEACESMADTLFNTVWTLGCRPYMNSQRAACVCAGEERDEL
uniref:group XIIB secretory phospholipase A2-like protein isoform X2 n=1 Tax=Semicossyphus pulcher TaxID=241346 RepID=UPI0037E7DCD0